MCKTPLPILLAMVQICTTCSEVMGCVWDIWSMLSMVMHLIFRPTMALIALCFAAQTPVNNACLCALTRAANNPMFCFLSLLSWRLFCYILCISYQPQSSISSHHHQSWTPTPHRLSPPSPSHLSIYLQRNNRPQPLSPQNPLRLHPHPAHPTTPTCLGFSHNQCPTTLPRCTVLTHVAIL